MEQLTRTVGYKKSMFWVLLQGTQGLSMRDWLFPGGLGVGSRRHGPSSTPQNPGKTQDQGFILGCGMSQAGKTNQKRQRERDSQTEMEKETERDTQRDRETEIHRESGTNTEIQR